MFFATQCYGLGKKFPTALFPSDFMLLLPLEVETIPACI